MVSVRTVFAGGLTRRWSGCPPKATSTAQLAVVSCYDFSSCNSCLSGLPRPAYIGSQVAFSDQTSSDWCACRTGDRFSHSLPVVLFQSLCSNGHCRRRIRYRAHLDACLWRDCWIGRRYHDGHYQKKKTANNAVEPTVHPRRRAGGRGLTHMQCIGAVQTSPNLKLKPDTDPTQAATLET